MKSSKTTEQLLKENEELQIRLAEAEETLQAIREGAVDAVVVQGPKGEQIFTLTGEERIYRLLIETMSEAGLTTTPEGRILFCNKQFSEMLRRPMEEIVGHTIEEFIQKSNHKDMADLLVSSLTELSRKRLVFVASDNTHVPAQVSANLLNQAGSVSVCMVAMDLTDIETADKSIHLLSEQQQALEESAAALRDSRRAALNLMEDALSAKQRAEQIGDELRKAHDELEIRVAERTKELTIEVAERKKAEQTIIAERKRFEDVLEMMPAYAILLTPDYHVAYANRTFRSWFGDDTGKKCFEFLFNRTEPCENCETYKVLKTGKSHFWEWTGPNGRSYDIYDYPFTNTDGSPLIMEIGVDVTAHKKAQAALYSASLYARSLIEASLDPLVTISAEGKITDVNDATIKVTGVSREKLIGTDFSDYFTEPLTAQQGYQKVFANGFVTDYPLTIRRKDGHLTDVLYNATVYKDTQGNVIGVLAAARDITEKKVIEAELEKYRLHLEEIVKQRTEELARSNKDLEQFAYVASHDLQEPLRAVAGFVEILRRNLQKSLDDKTTEYMDFISDGAKRMQSLINGLLDYSRIGTKGKKPTIISSKEALDDALARLKGSIKDTGAVITADDLPQVHFDQVQLTQLFQNLIGNAIKFRGERTPEVRISASRQDDAWKFSVTDNGIGIEPQYSERIFQIFQRLHNREQYPGTGIGLAVCKKIIERHGGKIWLESKPGNGSTFYFSIPDKIEKDI